MRPSCMECCYKHIANAAVFDTEVSLGYPGFLMYVVGHLDHAAQEARDEVPEFAWVLREHRINRFATESYRVPYEALGSFCRTLVSFLVQPEGHVPPKVPAECLAGLLIVDGDPVFSMDTRP